LIFYISGGVFFREINIQQLTIMVLHTIKITILIFDNYSRKQSIDNLITVKSFYIRSDPKLSYMNILQM
jgi:hypothetical protein